LASAWFFKSYFFFWDKLKINEEGALEYPPPTGD